MLFYRYLEHLIADYKQHFYLEQCAASGLLDEEARQIDSQTYLGIGQLLDKGKAEFQVKNLDNRLLIGFLLGASAEIAKLARQFPTAPSPEFMEAGFSLIWHGIRY